ncbi:hypothetical protein ACFX2I_029080 [Malus domestica]
MEMEMERLAEQEEEEEGELRLQFAELVIVYNSKRRRQVWWSERGKVLDIKCGKVYDMLRMPANKMYGPRKKRGIFVS